MKHADFQAGQNHVIENWVYADAAAREAATGFAAADVGKIAYQSDGDGSYWRLTATTPTWAAVSNSDAIDSAELATALAELDLDDMTNHGADVASAGTLDLDAASGDLVDVTGTTTVTAITLTEGRMRTVRFTGILTLTHDSSLVLPTAANVTTAAGDFAMFRGYAAGVVRCVSYQRADGTPLAGGGGGGSGTVTNTGGDLTSDAVVLGAGGDDSKVLASLGTSGQVLTSAGAGVPPTWEDPAGGSGGGTLTLHKWTASENQPPAANYATFNTRNSIAQLLFDQTTAESAIFVGIIPEGADFTTGITVRLFWTATSATTGNVIWTTAFERVNTDIDADSFATGIDSAAAAANGTSGIPTVTGINHSGSEIDGLTPGDLFRLKITRKAADGSDTLADDAELLAVEIQQR